MEQIHKKCIKLNKIRLHTIDKLKNTKIQDYNISTEKLKKIYEKCIKLNKKVSSPIENVKDNLIIPKKVVFKKCKKCSNKKCTCIRINCTLCNKHYSYLNCSMFLHEKICRNSNKVKCTLCNRFYSSKYYNTTHRFVKECHKTVNTHSFECYFCQEIFYHGRLLLKHLTNQHDNESLSKKMTELLFKNCPHYTGLVPWEWKSFTEIEKKEIVKIYSIWGSTHIFNKLNTDCNKIIILNNLTICPNVSLSDQICNYLHAHLKKYKQSFKIIFFPEYILQNIHTNEIKFMAAFRNFSITLKNDIPFQIDEYVDIKKNFEHMTYDKFNTKLMYNRPNTQWQSLLMTSLRLEITNSSMPLGAGDDIIRHNKNIIVMPTFKDYSNLCLFLGICYNIYLKNNGESFKRWVLLKKNQKLNIFKMAKNGYEKYVSITNRKNVTLNSISEIEKIFDVSCDLYTKTDDVISVEYFSINKQDKSRHFNFLILQNPKKYICHIACVKNSKFFLNKFKCDTCSFIFTRFYNYKRHVHSKGCLNINKKIFPGGEHDTKPLTLCEKLCSLGFNVCETDFIKDKAIFFDFESFQKIQPRSNHHKNTNVIFELVPFAYSICDSSLDCLHVQEKQPKKLVENFMKDLLHFSKKISDNILPKFKHILDKLHDDMKILEDEILLLKNKISRKKIDSEFVSTQECIEIFQKSSQQNDLVSQTNYFIENIPTLKKSMSYMKLTLFHLKNKLKNILYIYTELQEFINVVPCISFNQSFDLNLCKKYLFKILLDKFKKIFVLKKHNKYILVKCAKLKFIDIQNFLAPNISLDNFSKSMSPNENTHKSYLNYERINYFNQLKSKKVPEYSHFYSNLKGHNVFETEFMNLNYSPQQIRLKGILKYNEWKKIWVAKDYSLGKYIENYTNIDVKILAKSTHIFFNFFFKVFQISIFDFISLPQIARKLLKLECYKNGCILPKLSSNNQCLFYALKTSMTGGSSQIYNRFCDSQTTAGNNSPIVNVTGFDSNALYAYCLSKSFPSGHPILYLKNSDENTFYIQKNKTTLKSQNVWLKYIEQKYNLHIFSKMNTGHEIKRLGFLLDGYITYTTENKHFFKLINIKNKNNYFKACAFEFFGCFWHSCGICNKNVKKDINYDLLKKCLFKIYTLLKHGIFVVWTFECCFEIELHTNRKLQNIFEEMESYTFYKQFKNKKITSNSFINNITNNVFFGYLTVDLEIPKKHPYIDFSTWPAFFCNVVVNYSHWSNYMKDKYGKTTSLTKDRRLLIQANRIKRVTLSSSLIKFYLNCGIKISHIYTAYEFQKKYPYRNLVEKVTNLRREADLSQNPVQAQCCKLILNVLFGSTYMEKCFHKIITYTKNLTLIRNTIRTSFFYSLNEVSPKMYELIQNKRKIVMDTLIYHTNFILDRSKKVLNDFVWNFIMKCLNTASYIILASDTDSVYIALTASSIDKLVKKQYLPYYLWMVGLDKNRTRCTNNLDLLKTISKNVFFPRKCCDLHIKYDSRTPSLFKIEKEVNNKPLYIGVSSKKILLKSEKSICKLTFSGLKKSNFNKNMCSVVDMFEKPLLLNVPTVGTNYCMNIDPSNKNRMVFYEQERVIQSGLYIKRQVCDDGVNTLPLNLILTPDLGFDQNVVYINDNHYLSLDKQINLFYKGKFYKTIHCYLKQFYDKTNIHFKKNNKKILLFLLECLKQNIYEIDRLAIYSDKLLLFLGCDQYYTSGISSFEHLRNCPQNDLLGHNKLSEIFQQVISI